MRAKDALGRYGEDVAVRHLIAQGIGRAFARPAIGDELREDQRSPRCRRGADRVPSPVIAGIDLLAAVVESVHLMIHGDGHAVVAALGSVDEVGVPVLGTVLLAVERMLEGRTNGKIVFTL